MNLLIEYFKSTNKNRDIEYKTCISENTKNSIIERIIIFISDDSQLDIESDKITIIRMDNRPTFNYLFQYCNENLNGDICIISNTDIFFDDTLSILKSVDISNDFISLTRWDLIFKDEKWYIEFYNHLFRGGPATTGMLSQDSWIFKSPIKIDSRSSFLMGKPGCDNRIVQIYHENGYNVKNPSMQIISKHLHISNYRTYNHTDMIIGPYLLVQPTNNINIDSQKQTIPNF